MTVITAKTRVDYTACEAKKFVLSPGTYGLEVVGASGGSSISKGGYGGRSYGKLRLTETTTIFVHVGERGVQAAKNSFSRTTCNGGGKAYGYPGLHNNMPGSGGGSTDIRIGSDDLLRRVIVAGGGGGAGTTSGEKGGDGGGKIGGSGQGSKGGIGGQEVWCPNKCKDGSNCPPGKLFYGGDAPDSADYYSGGGGGLIGGAASKNAEGGGGGSGYIFSEDSRRDKNITSLEERYFLTEAITEISTNEGNGYAIITPIKIFPSKSQSPYPSQTIQHSLLCSPKNNSYYKSVITCLAALLSINQDIAKHRVHVRLSVELEEH